MRLRFRLRTLLAAITALCVVLAMFLQHAYRYRERKTNAEALILSLRGDISYFGTSPQPSPGDNFLARRFGLSESSEQLWDVNLRGTMVSSNELAALADCDWIRSLDLSRTTIQNSDMEHVARLVKLRKLALNETAIDDAGIVVLKPLERLVELQTQDTAVTVDGLRKLDKSIPYRCFGDMKAFEYFPRPGISVFPISTVMAVTESFPDEPGHPLFRRGPDCSIHIKNGGGINPRDLLRLQELTHAKELKVRSDQPLVLTEVFGSLKELEWVELVGESLNEAEVDALATIPCLKSLRLRSQDFYQVRDTEPADNSSWPQPYASVEDIRLLSRLQNLVELELEYDAYTFVNDSEAKREELRQAAETLHVLGAMSNLRRVSILGNQFDAEAVKIVASFPHVKWITYDRTHVSDVTIQNLVEVRPDCVFVDAQGFAGLMDMNSEAFKRYEEEQARK